MKKRFYGHQEKTVAQRVGKIPLGQMQQIGQVRLK